MHASLQPCTSKQGLVVDLHVNLAKSWQMQLKSLAVLGVQSQTSLRLRYKQNTPGHYMQNACDQYMQNPSGRYMQKHLVSTYKQNILT